MKIWSRCTAFSVFLFVKRILVGETYGAVEVKRASIANKPRLMTAAKHEHDMLTGGLNLDAKVANLVQTRLWDKFSKLRLFEWCSRYFAVGFHLIVT